MVGYNALNIMTTSIRYPSVSTKKGFVRRYRNGEFGNRAPTWNNWEEFEREYPDSYPSRLHLRNRIAGGTTHYDLEWHEAKSLWNEYALKGLENNWYLSGMAPHQYNTIQGEIQEGIPFGLSLYYSLEPDLPMRDALAKSSHTAERMMAISYLKTFMCPNSWDWLKTLLDRYPCHVIEFSCFSINWGTLPNYNTVFWEVRNY